MPFCLQESFSPEISNMRASLDQLNLQVQLPDLVNPSVIFHEHCWCDCSGYGLREFHIEIT